MPTSPPHRSRKRAPSHVGWRLIGLLVLGVTLIWGVPELAPKIADIIVGAATAGLMPRESEIGTTVTVPADSTRPDLEVAATDVRRQANDPTGSHSVAVDLQIKNVGSTRYVSGTELRVSLVDHDGVRYWPEASATALGRAFEKGLSLRPGHSVEGRIFFDLPAGAHPAKVRLTVGSAGDETVDWALHG
jgi:hypothetical protein